MTDDDKIEFAKLRADLQAARLAANEAMSIALSHEVDPDKAVSLARGDLRKIVDETRAKMLEIATDETNRQFGVWFAGLVGESIESLMDQVEKRVSQLKQNRALH